jgi:hypothetical protein
MAAVAAAQGIQELEQVRSAIGHFHVQAALGGRPAGLEPGLPQAAFPLRVLPRLRAGLVGGHLPPLVQDLGAQPRVADRTELGVVFTFT